MGLQELKERFRGREFWRSINRGLGIGIYSLLIFGIILFPMYLGYIMFGLAIFVPSYGFFFVNHLREIEKQDKGGKLVKGWITHAYGVGEPIFFTPLKFELVEKLSPDNLKVVKKYVNTLNEMSKAAKLKIGLDKFKPKSLTQAEIIELETKNEEDINKFEEDEKIEKTGFENDFDEIIQGKANKKIITINEDEPDEN